MAMQIGDLGATSGMTKAIYDKMRELMEPIDGVTGEDLDVVTRGDISATVSGSTATQNNVAFAQDDTEPGRIQ